MAEILSIISIVSFAAAGIFFVLAVIFWIKFKILFVIGDLSGKNARKSIEQMRRNNEKTGSKSYRTSTVNKNRGKLTETMKESGKLAKKAGKNKSRNGELATELLAENKVRTLLSEATELLSASDEATELLSADDGATELLSDENETALLAEHRGKAITLMEEVMLIHTDEMIF